MTRHNASFMLSAEHYKLEVQMKQFNAWVFDLDDTLMSNVHDYAHPILDACGLIIDTLGDAAPHVSAIIALEQEVDQKRVKETSPVTGKPYGYSMERFPTSLVEVYRQICRCAGKQPENGAEKELMRIGLEAFDPDRYRKDLYSDTMPTLTYLQKRGDRIFLLTKGDKRVQGNKLSILDAGKRFARVEVVDDKTPGVFSEIVKGFEDHRLFSVGNDYEKDIVPAFEAGYHCGVWIPVETWEVIGRLDEIRTKIDWTRCVELHSLRELIERYDEIVGGGE